MTTAAEEHVLDESGHFHAVDEPIDLSGYGWEDWLTFVMFWLLALDVFYQFFTRYVLADSAAWTEEIARYLLIVVCFVGSSMGVRRSTYVPICSCTSSLMVARRHGAVRSMSRPP